MTNKSNIFVPLKIFKIVSFYGTHDVQKKKKQKQIICIINYSQL